MGLNPQMIMSLLGARMGQGATGAGAGPEDVNPAMRDLQGADPEYALKLITNAKKQIVEMIPVLALRAPGAARALASTMKGLDAALKELQQAQATMQAVGGPVEMSAIPRPAGEGSSGAPQLLNAAGRGM